MSTITSDCVPGMFFFALFMACIQDFSGWWAGEVEVPGGGATIKGSTDLLFLKLFFWKLHEDEYNWSKRGRLQGPLNLPVYYYLCF